ncbi:hypothetical protein U1701_18320 [Sphingomonas sp. PB2P19]|uniref:hypothetical protein n=1 Tax=Sphingomonas rhamnosi TaxID=3096156 RepID=UPI002FCA7BB5
MFYQPDLFESAQRPEERLTTAAVLERITQISRRPKYAFFVLQLIADAAGEGESAGPYVGTGNRRVPVRDWLCDALIPTAQRDARRRANVQQIREELARQHQLPSDPDEAQQVIDEALREKVRRSGRCNVSRAVSDLVRAGLVRRHYQGYRVDHENRGAQREAVYTILPAAASAFRGRR